MNTEKKKTERTNSMTLPCGIVCLVELVARDKRHDSAELLAVLFAKALAVFDGQQRLDRVICGSADQIACLHCDQLVLERCDPSLEPERVERQPAHDDEDRDDDGAWDADCEADYEAVVFDDVALGRHHHKDAVQ